MKRFRVSLALLAFVLLMGTAGFVWCGRSWASACYQTVVVLTTVGMEGPQSDAERVWSMVLMMAGVGLVVYTTGQIVAFFIEGQLSDAFQERKRMRQIDHLNDHQIVIGYGRMGQALCQCLRLKEAPFVVIDNDPKHVTDAREQGHLVLMGDATREKTLLDAGLERASSVAVCLSDDAHNVFVTLTTRSLNNRVHILTRAEHRLSEPKLRHAGASHVVCPADLGAMQLSLLMLNPGVEQMLELDGHWPDLELSRVAVRRMPALIGKTVEALHEWMDTEVSVVALITADGRRLLRPTEDQILEEGDQLVFVSPTGLTQKIMQQFGITEAA